MKDVTDRVLMPQNTRLKVQWNWNRYNDVLDLPALDEGGFNAPIYLLNVVKPNPTYTMQGIAFALEVVISVVDGQDRDTFTRLKYNKNGQNAGPRAWPAGMLASDIFKSIADFYGWNNYVVEPTTGILPEMRMTAIESHNDFIVKRLLPRAHNATNDRFLFYVDPYLQVNFHSVAWQANPDVTSSVSTRDIYISRAYRVFKDKMGEVLEFTPSDLTWAAMMSGGGNGVHEAVDSAAGEPVWNHTSATTGVNGAGPGTVVTGNTEYATTVAIPGQTGDAAQPSPLQPIKGRDANDYNNQSTAWFSLRNSMNYQAEMTVRGTHAIFMTDAILVEYYNSSNSDALINYLSGVFTVMGVEQRVDSGGWVTALQLMRTGMNPPTADKTSGRTVHLSTASGITYILPQSATDDP